MNKRCHSIKELLSPYLDGELNSEELKLVEEHLAECSACQQEFATLKKLDKAITELEIEDPSREFYPRIIHALSKEYRKRGKHRSFLLQLAPLAAAASILIIVLVASQAFLIQYPEYRARDESITMKRGKTGEISSGGAAKRSKAKAPAVEESDVLDEVEKPVTSKAGREDVAFFDDGIATKKYKAAAERSITEEEKAKAAEKISAPSAITQTNAEIDKKAAQPQQKPEIAGGSEKAEQQVAGLATGRRNFDEEIAPRKTGTTNEFEFDVSPDDIVAQNVSSDKRVAIVVDLDSSGNVLQAALKNTTGSDTVDSMVVRNARNQNFRTLTRGVERFPSRQDIYYRFRQTGE